VIQYSETSVMESRSRGVLDRPLSRRMTVLGGAGVMVKPRSNPYFLSLRRTMDCFVARAPRNDGVAV
jgi:hypothetical protein